MDGIENLSFEQALERLEQVVNELDAGELPLDEALKRFEEGMTLKKRCAVLLGQAEAKVQEYVAEASEDDGETS